MLGIKDLLFATMTINSLVDYIFSFLRKLGNAIHISKSESGIFFFMLKDFLGIQILIYF